MKILVINGPNLNMLGKRNPDEYGNITLDDIEKKILKEFPNHEFEFFQSNIEGEIVSKIQTTQNNFDALVINSGGYTHTSVAIKDALEILTIPKIEVHLSKLASREDFRQKMITTTSVDGYISGFKEKSYLAAIYLLVH
ncbi:MAG: 3-dehydroquinate dehydratase [Ignavibacteriae bacterium]|nr:MAG: 3-dehydroquinate dehydratase [Ignavibacteriota bacterium]